MKLSKVQKMGNTFIESDMFCKYELKSGELL